MAWRPQLNVVCHRCGKPRLGIVHHCAGNSRREATLSLDLSWGTCPKCKKAYTAGGPLTHTCHPRSDFRRRKSAHAKRERAKARRKRQAEAHDYQACSDKDCPRPLCVAYKTGEKAGYERGFDDGFGAGFGAGMAAASSSGAA